MGVAIHEKKERMNMVPNPRNFCGGSFQDWLEVMLTEKCNGRCSWCVEKGGFHPKYHATSTKICEKILKTNKKTIILLGGEPSLYPHLRFLCQALFLWKRNIYMTTNGSKLSQEFVKSTLIYLSGINISIHHYNLNKNLEITGISLDKGNLKKCIKLLSSYNITVRLNCNLIRNFIDSKKEIYRYIHFAKELGVSSVRFAELKNDDKNFINLFELFKNKYGINNEPFGLGCNCDCRILNMPVNFRQMCGLQTSKRKKPQNPMQYSKQVLYYNGKIYSGWQPKGEGKMKKKQSINKQKIKKIMEKVSEGKLSVDQATLLIDRIKTKVIEKYISSGGGGCQY